MANPTPPTEAPMMQPFYGAVMNNDGEVIQSGHCSQIIRDEVPATWDYRISRLIEQSRLDDADREIEALRAENQRLHSGVKAVLELADYYRSGNCWTHEDSADGACGTFASEICAALKAASI